MIQVIQVCFGFDDSGFSIILGNSGVSGVLGYSGYSHESGDSAD